MQMTQETTRTNKIKMDIPALSFRAAFEPSTIDAEKRTVVLRWSTGAKVLRGGFFTEPFHEELSLQSEAVRMDRLKSGAPLLNSHASRSLSDQIGVVEDAWLEGGSGYARVRFSGRQDTGPIFQDVKDGIVRNVSVGYRVYKYKDVSQEGDPVKTMRAVDWEPMEISLVPIGADAGASIRSEKENLNECEVEVRAQTKKVEEKTMSKENTAEARDTLAHPENPNVDIEAVKRETLEAERKRISEITTLVRKFNLDDAFCKSLVDQAVSVEEARSQILNKLAERSEKDGDIRGQVSVQITRDEADTRRAGMIESLLHRYDPKANKLNENSSQYTGMSLLRLAEEVLTRNRIAIRGMTKSDIAQRAFESTSDFPEILSNVANKTLRQAYEMAPQTFRPFVRQVFNPDFKEVSRVQLSEAPKLEKVNQSGEFKYGSLSDSAEKYSLGTFGKIIAINRQVIINDDLEAFTRIPALYGRAAADLESDLVYAVLIANAAMGDGIALFHASHSNLGAPGAISEVTLGEGRKLMRRQTGLQKGKDKQLLNVQARYLIVPAALETAAQKQLAAITPRNASDVNPFSGLYTLIAEPRLDDNSATAWYMSADPSQIDTIEIAYLQGQAGIYTENRLGFEIDGLEIKARLDFAVKAIDHRGLFKNAG